MKVFISALTDNPNFQTLIRFAICKELCWFGCLIQNTRSRRSHSCITSTKEIMFSCCLVVCYLAGLHTNYWADYQETWWKDLVLFSRDPFTCWCRSEEMDTSRHFILLSLQRFSQNLLTHKHHSHAATPILHGFFLGLCPLLPPLCKCLFV